MRGSPTGLKISKYLLYHRWNLNLDKNLGKLQTFYKKLLTEIPLLLGFNTELILLVNQPLGKRAIAETH